MAWRMDAVGGRAHLGRAKASGREYWEPWPQRFVHDLQCEESRFGGIIAMLVCSEQPNDDVGSRVRCGGGRERQGCRARPTTHVELLAR